MPAPATPTPYSARGIVAYVAVGRKPHDQRERIEAALAAVGLEAVEIVEEDAAHTFERGRYGIARVRELAASSAVDLLVVAEASVLFNTPQLVECLRHDMVQRGVSVLALE